MKKFKPDALRPESWSSTRLKNSWSDVETKQIFTNFCFEVQRTAWNYNLSPLPSHIESFCKKWLTQNKELPSIIEKMVVSLGWGLVNSWFLLGISSFNRAPPQGVQTARGDNPWDVGHLAFVACGIARRAAPLTACGTSSFGVRNSGTPKTSWKDDIWPNYYISPT